MEQWNFFANYYVKFIQDLKRKHHLDEKDLKILNDSFTFYLEFYSN